MDSSRKQRILTGALFVPAVLAAIFGLPSDAVFLVSLTVFVWAADEMLRIARHWAPSAPLKILLVLIPLEATALAYLLRQEIDGPSPGTVLIAVGLGGVLVASLIPLLGGTRVEEGLAAIGVFAFAIPYFSLPAVSIYALHRIDPWLALALILVVSSGDTGAYFIGSWLGRRKMAPKISPKKSWEGAIAGLLASVLVMALWCLGRLGEISAGWLALAAVTALAAQLGDLVESFLKRGAGVKDSSQILPGHGGIYDRVDAFLLAAPVFLVGIWILGHGG